MMTMTATAKSFTYETATCGRCGGSGRMPFAVYGGVCFGCNGNGEKITRRGATARRKVEEWADANLTVAASTLQPGDQINDRGSRRTVVARDTQLGKGNGTLKIGVEGTDSFIETWTYGRTIIETQKKSIHLPAHAPVRRWWTRDDIATVAELFGHLKGLVVTYEDDDA